MRIKQLLLITLVSILTLSSCGDDADSGNGGGGGSSSVTINLSQTTVNSPAVGGTFSVNVKTTGNEWTAFVNDDASNWLQLSITGSASNSGVATVTVKPNTGASRTATITVKSGTGRATITVVQSAALQVSKKEINSNSRGESFNIDVTSSEEWQATASDSWISTSVNGSLLTVTTAANDSKASRTGKVTVTAGAESVDISVYQESAEDREIVAPDGYALVWHDEFNEGTQLSTAKWEWENQNSGWVNNELQNYRPGTQTIDGMHTTEIVDGRLNINCFKASDGKIYSGRINAKNGGKGWQYGYIEARMMLPKGKGTWPAYWMMPITVDWANEGWPKCGEIDIMEEVGCVPNEVSSSLHAEGHKHTNNTQVTKARNIGTAESEYHVYALEWTKDYIKTYVDGNLLLSYTSDHTVRNYPYDKPFHIILNLAWGGSWGGMYGVDNSALPCTMKVDYVRVFQKK